MHHSTAFRVARTLVITLLLPASAALAQSQAASNAPLRVVVAGLVHGHASGFLEHYQKRPDLQIVGIAEPNQQLAADYARRFGLDSKLLYGDLEDALQKTHPDAVLAYTNTYDHRKVVEICARHSVHVMMEKPLAVSFDDARAMESCPRR